MKSNRLLRTIIIVLLLALNIGCDQASKTLMRHRLQYYDRIEFFHRHFTLQRVENPGAFLSLGDSLSGPLRLILLNIIPFFAIAYGLYFIFKKTNLSRVLLLGLILIIGGGAGNLYDRIVHGSVTDFMYIHFELFHTGVFNVADMSIMAGMFIILIHALFKPKDEAGVNNISTENKI